MILLSQTSDEKIILSIQKFRFRPLTWLLVLFTWTGKGRVWVTIAVFLNVFGKSFFNHYFLKAFYAPLLVWMINGVLKRIYKRDRPAIANKNIVALVKQAGFSFPSSHSGSTFAFAFTLLWWQFPEAKYFFVWATIVSYSRMYLGVHYLTDIVAGILVGLVSSGIIFLIF